MKRIRFYVLQENLNQIRSSPTDAQISNWGDDNETGWRLGLMRLNQIYNGAKKWKRKR